MHVNFIIGYFCLIHYNTLPIINLRGSTSTAECDGLFVAGFAGSFASGWYKMDERNFAQRQNN